MNQEELDKSQWVDRYGDLMYRYTLVRVKDQDSAEEIVQSTFLAALQSYSTFEGRSSEKSWLFGILKHKILDHFRHIKKIRTFDLQSDDDADPFDFDASSGHWKEMPRQWDIDPQKAAENQQLMAVLNHCLNNLSDKFRQIFILKEIEGLNSEEICKDFEIKPTNLWVMLHRARNQLKKCLESNWMNSPANE